MKKESYHFLIHVHVYWYDPHGPTDAFEREYPKAKPFPLSKLPTSSHTYLLISIIETCEVIVQQQPFEKGYEMKEFIDILLEKNTDWKTIAQKYECTNKWITQKSHVPSNGLKPIFHPLPISAFQSSDMAGIWANLN